MRRELARETAETANYPRFPTFLPDGRHLFFYWQAPGESEAGLYVIALDSGQPKRLAAADTGAVYAAPRMVFYGRQSTLFVQPFDLATLSFQGEPTPIADHLESGVFGGVLAFSVSTNARSSTG